MEWGEKGPEGTAESPASEGVSSVPRPPQHWGLRKQQMTSQGEKNGLLG